MKLFKIAALFLLSISTHAALADEINPYSQAEFNKLAAEGKPILPWGSDKTVVPLVAAERAWHVSLPAF